jgi:hypothetical protein
MAHASESDFETSPNESEKFFDKLKDDGLERVKTTQRSAAGQLEGVAAAIDRASSELDETQPTVAHYVGQLASGINGFASRLKEGSVDDLVSDAQRFAKSNPTMFLLGSVGVGMLLARFLKASSRQESTDSGDALDRGRAAADGGAASPRAQTFAASVEDSGVFEPSYSDRVTTSGDSLSEGGADMPPPSAAATGSLSGGAGGRDD